MKSKDFQKLVLSKYSKSKEPTKIFRNLNGFVSFHIIELLCKSVRETCCIDLSKSAGRPRRIRMKVAIRKVKTRWQKRQCVASPIIVRQLAVSRASIQRILRHNLRLKSYAVLKNPLLINKHKEKRTSSVTGFQQIFVKKAL